MKRLVLTIALLCALSATAVAGEVPTTGAPVPGHMMTEPQPPSDVTSTGSTSPGEMPIGGLSALLTILDLAF